MRFSSRVLLTVISVLAFSCMPIDNYLSARQEMTRDNNQNLALPAYTSSPAALKKGISLLGNYVTAEQVALSGVGQLVQNIHQLNADQMAQVKKAFTPDDYAALLVEQASIETGLVSARIACGIEYIDSCANIRDLVSRHLDESVSLSLNYLSVLSAE